ncbi:hypothetical protein [Caniella muris]|uniref:hypothetical protein n=1 Tax=Caniella muris TaxID=2941502 RepID=UPI00203AC345|nr:hypothetical protein [Caniella muris]
MKFFMRLPRNGREFALFLLVVSLISVNLIAPTVTCMELGFSPEAWGATYSAIVFVWVLVVACVVATKRPVEHVCAKVADEGDSYNMQVLLNIVVSVLFLSVLLTLLAPMVATGETLGHSAGEFVYRWPRNFGVALFVEALIAQPIARAVMNRYHLALDRRGASRTVEERA